jgi:hypothetical protein
MTLLQIVNNILRRMREDEVPDVSQNKYSKMVVDFVNDAKTLVENAWDWSTLRREVVVTTVNNVSDYLVEDATPQTKLFYFVNDNTRQYMEYRTTAWIEQQRINSDLKGSPKYFTYYNADGVMRVRLWPTPDAAYTLRYYAKFPQDFLENSGDVIRVPYMPVQHMALALLARERGETGGTSVAEYFAVADNYLSDAIAYDAAHHPEDLIFTVP